MIESLVHPLLPCLGIGYLRVFSWALKKSLLKIVLGFVFFLSSYHDCLGASARPAISKLKPDELLSFTLAQLKQNRGQLFVVHDSHSNIVLPYVFNFQGLSEGPTGSHRLYGEIMNGNHKENLQFSSFVRPQFSGVSFFPSQLKVIGQHPSLLNIDILRPSIFAADDMFELGNGESGRFFIFTHWPSGQIEISLENALDWIQKGTREIQADQEKPALLSNIPWYSLEYFLKQHENEIFFTHGPNSLPWTLSTHHALLGTSGKLSYLVSKATLGDQTFDLVFKPLSMARLDLQFEFRHCLDLNHKEKHVRQSSFSYDFELLKDRVLVAEYLFGGKTPLSKTFFLIVNWPTQEVELWVESKNGKGKSKIERQALTHLRDSCRQKMSSDFH